MRTARERQKPKPCETKARFFFRLLCAGGQESALKVPKRGPFQVAIRATTKRCDLFAQGAQGRRRVSRRKRV